LVGQALNRAATRHPPARLAGRTQGPAEARAPQPGGMHVPFLSPARQRIWPCLNCPCLLAAAQRGRAWMQRSPWLARSTRSESALRNKATLHPRPLCLAAYRRRSDAWFMRSGLSVWPATNDLCYPNRLHLHCKLTRHWLPILNQHPMLRASHTSTAGLSPACGCRLTVARGPLHLTGTACPQLASLVARHAPRAGGERAPHPVPVASSAHPKRTTQPQPQLLPPLVVAARAPWPAGEPCTPLPLDRQRPRAPLNSTSRTESLLVYLPGLSALLAVTVWGQHDGGQFINKFAV
jgi:hypothetical protein